VKAGALLAAVLVATLVGCSGSPPSSESVVRAWSQALNSDDNETAAKLFAPGARVVQGNSVLRLRTHREALAWNSSLPCSGRIVSIESKGETAKATFVLGDRTHSRCDGPGQKATAIFRVVQGKIVLWHQTGTSNAPVITATA
jgi:limonene-1,2-epoxide hydrolase